jgi:hypothetical protein
MAELDYCPFVDRAAVALFVAGELFCVSCDRLEMLLEGVSTQMLFRILLCR